MNTQAGKRNARAELDAIAEGLGPDEVRVLVFVAGRLAHGREQYGELNLTTDARDFRHERAEELADALVYTACEELRRLAPVMGAEGQR